MSLDGLALGLELLGLWPREISTSTPTSSETAFYYTAVDGLLL